MIASEPAVTETTEVVEPTTADTTENQPQDAWSEDFDTADIPNEESTPKPVDEPEEVQPEYKTEGLGALDTPLVVKRKGKLYDLTDLDQIRDLVERGLDSTVKNQELADMRRELLKEQNPDMTNDQLTQADTDNEVEHIAQTIMNSTYADDFKDVITALPQSEVDRFRSDPKLLEGLRVDVASGFAKQIMPQVDRLINVDGMSFEEAYFTAGKALHDKQEVKQSRIDKLTAQPDTNNNVQVKQQSIWDIPDNEFRSLMDTERR